MKIKVETVVNADFTKVYTAFDQQLFKALNPPLLPVKLLRFDGCQKGDEVHLQFPFGVRWVSLITDSQTSMEKFVFVDEGRILPFPLKNWKHQHKVLRKNHKTMIVDDIYYQTHHILLDWLLYPVLYMQFLYRKPVYRRYFEKKKVSR